MLRKDNANAKQCKRVMHKKCDWAKYSLVNGYIVFGFWVCIVHEFNIQLDWHSTRPIAAILGAKCALFPTNQIFL